eukprot:scaffold30752_cov90-Isochrysis_galbana.AAC.2
MSPNAEWLSSRHHGRPVAPRPPASRANTPTRAGRIAALKRAECTRASQASGSNPPAAAAPSALPAGGSSSSAMAVPIWAARPVPRRRAGGGVGRQPVRRRRVSAQAGDGRAAAVLAHVPVARAAAKGLAARLLVLTAHLARVAQRVGVDEASQPVAIWAGSRVREAGSGRPGGAPARGDGHRRPEVGGAGARLRRRGTDAPRPGRRPVRVVDAALHLACRILPSLDQMVAAHVPHAVESVDGRGRGAAGAAPAEGHLAVDVGIRLVLAVEVVVPSPKHDERAAQPGECFQVGQCGRGGGRGADAGQRAGGGHLCGGGGRVARCAGPAQVWRHGRLAIGLRDGLAIGAGRGHRVAPYGAELCHVQQRDAQPCLVARGGGRRAHEWPRLGQPGAVHGARDGRGPGGDRRGAGRFGARWLVTHLIRRRHKARRRRLHLAPRNRRRPAAAKLARLRLRRGGAGAHRPGGGCGRLEEPRRLGQDGAGILGRDDQGGRQAERPIGRLHQLALLHGHEDAFGGVRHREVNAKRVDPVKLQDAPLHAQPGPAEGRGRDEAHQGADRAARPCHHVCRVQVVRGVEQMGSRMQRLRFVARGHAAGARRDESVRGGCQPPAWVCSGCAKAGGWRAAHGRCQPRPRRRCISDRRVEVAVIGRGERAVGSGGGWRVGTGIDL